MCDDCGAPLDNELQHFECIQKKVGVYVKTVLDQYFREKVKKSVERIRKPPTQPIRVSNNITPENTCPFCEVSFFTRIKLIAHCVDNHANEFVTCAICFALFKKNAPKEFMKHDREMHSNDRVEVNVTEGTSACFDFVLIWTFFAVRRLQNTRMFLQRMDSTERQWQQMHQMLKIISEKLIIPSH